MKGKGLPTLYEVRGKWRDQTYRDRRLTHGTFRIAYGLAEYMTMTDTTREYEATNGKNIIIFPKQQEIANRAGVCADTVVEGIRQLIDRGHLVRVKRGNQFVGSNTYKIILLAEGRA